MRKFNKLFRWGLVCKACGKLDTAYVKEHQAKKGAELHATLYRAMGEGDHMVVVFDGLQRQQQQAMLDL